MRTSVRVNIDSAKIKRVVAAGSRKGVWMALDHLLSVSKEQVPLDEGTLQFSGAVDVNDDGTEGSVSYDTPYAVKQHEDQSLSHQRGRKAKYLEDPVNDAGVQEEMLELVQRGMSSEMG